MYFVLSFLDLLPENHLLSMIVMNN
jgi:hypothetical protein